MSLIYIHTHISNQTWNDYLRNQNSSLYMPSYLATTGELFPGGTSGNPPANANRPKRCGFNP